MVENRAFIEISNIKYIDYIEEAIRSIIPQQVEIVWKGNIGTITSFDVDCFCLSLKKILDMEIIEIGVKIAILIVPKFDDLFIKYLHMLNNEVATCFEVFIKNINSENVLKDAKKILSSIPNKDILTIKAFIDSNMNSLKAADALFLHRNSFNYRLNQFIYASDMDIRDINTIMFLNLLFNIQS